MFLESSFESGFPFTSSLSINKRRAVGSAVLQIGHSCWRIAEARRAAVLVDSAAYFRELEESLRRATRSILIVGWDFDGRMALRPGEQPVGELLRQLVEERPLLEVRILVWRRHEE